MPGKGPYYLVTAIGGLFVYSALHRYSVLKALQNIISGKAPAEGQKSAALGSGFSNPSPGASFGQTVTDNQVANQALTYQGHCYLYGGAPGSNGQACWDCSSFVNWVVGHDLGMKIPYGNPYNGSSHGPPTGAWGLWWGLQHISRSQVQAGDIIVWTGHMGIAINNVEMISAMDPADGTRIGNIDGGGDGPLMCYGRLKQTNTLPTTKVIQRGIGKHQ